MAGQKTLQLFILFMVLILLMGEVKPINARGGSRKRRSKYKPKKPSITELAKKVQELEDRLAEIEKCKRKLEYYPTQEHPTAYSLNIRDLKHRGRVRGRRREKTS